jgi:hypothetical protein
MRLLRVDEQEEALVALSALGTPLVPVAGEQSAERRVFLPARVGTLGSVSLVVRGSGRGWSSCWRSSMKRGWPMVLSMVTRFW